MAEAVILVYENKGIWKSQLYCGLVSESVNLNFTGPTPDSVIEQIEETRFDVPVASCQVTLDGIFWIPVLRNGNDIFATGTPVKSYGNCYIIGCQILCEFYGARISISNSETEHSKEFA